MIQHSKPTIGDEEIAAVEKVLRSGQVAQGRIVKEFEKKTEEYLGVRYATAVNSGSSALHLSLLALKLKKGSEIILPSYVCSAPLNAILYCDLTPKLVDVDLDSFNISVDDIKKNISEKTKAIIVPHMFGHPAEIEEICELAKSKDIYVIEDCALSIGSEYDGEKAGSFGDVTCLSFYATKMLTTGEGGMIVTKNEEFHELTKILREYDPYQSRKLTEISKKTSQKYLRYNYKMTDINAVMGLEQLKKLDYFIKERIKLAKRYTDGLEDTPLMLPSTRERVKHIYFRYMVKSKNPVRFPELRERYIKKEVQIGRGVSIPLHSHPYFEGANQRIFKNTDKIYSSAFSLPIYPLLQEEELDVVLESTKNIFC